MTNQKVGFPSGSLPGQGHTESPSSDLRGQTRTAGESQLAGRCRQCCILLPGELEELPGGTGNFLIVFILRFFILRNMKIFPSNKSNNNSKEKCLQKRARLTQCKQIKTD